MTGHVNDWSLQMMKLLAEVNKKLGPLVQRHTELLLAKSFAAICNSTCALCALIGFNSVCTAVFAFAEGGVDCLSRS